MNLIRSINHQCVLASFAMVMNVSTDNLLQHLGHDGLERVLDTSPPNCFRSFHPQEFVDILLSQGYACTMVELNPHLKNGTKIVDHSHYLGHNRFYKSLRYGSGVIFGSLNGIGHAVAWNQPEAKIYDPRGYIYFIHDREDFKPLQFFLIQKVEEPCTMTYSTPDKAL